MVENSEKPRSRVTPSQCVLVGVLAFALVGVLVMQFGTASASSSTATGPATAAAPDSRRSPGAKGAAGNQRSNGRWPETTLATALQFDPFARPASLVLVKPETQPGSKSEKSVARRAEDAEKQRAERERTKADRERLHADHERVLAEVRRDVVRTVVGTDRGFVAVVGTKTLRTGDRLHGLLVTKITPDGLVLEDRNDRDFSK
jgi:hypothetical protein